ncbi:MAG: nitrile hydratase subunit beta, partial [Candidatus Binatia bacterium]
NIPATHNRPRWLKTAPGRAILRWGGSMDGIHDLGGMDGLGRVEHQPKEPAFHAAWEGRVFGMNVSLLGRGCFNSDEFRHSIERMDPGHYLRSGYYEHWLDGVTRLLREKGIVASEELEVRVSRSRTRRRLPAGTAANDAALVEGLRTMIALGGSTRRETAAPPRFASGDRVIVRRMHPSGHTRCPRYVRGARGVVERCHGGFVLPDASAHGRRDRAEPVYTVRFDAAEVWGGGETGTNLYVDLWEGYLEGEPR